MREKKKNRTLLLRGVALSLSLMMMSVMAGCGGSDGTASHMGNTGTTTVEEILQPEVTIEDVREYPEAQVAQEEEEEKEPLPPVDLEKIDVDLTQLTSDLVYAEVNNMMTVPEEYEGKTIKMNGQASVYHDQWSGNTYYSCIIQDAAACCAQGLEFYLSDENQYPNEGDDVAVVGIFDVYKEGSFKYCALKNSVILDETT